MKPGDLITILEKCDAASIYLAQLNNQNNFIGLVVDYTPIDIKNNIWYNIINVAVPTENGLIYRLLLTELELKNNFLIINTDEPR